MRRVYAKVGLVLMGVVFVFAISSFLRENWGADARPGPIETFLAQWVLRGSRQAEGPRQNPYPATEENLRQGRRRYEDRCAFCHGTDGGGQSRDGMQFYPPVPSLLESAPEMSDGQLHAIVSRGIRYTGMPSFAQALNEDQIWKVVLWVRHLSRQPRQTPPAGGGSPGP